MRRSRVTERREERREAAKAAATAKAVQPVQVSVLPAPASTVQRRMEQVSIVHHVQSPKFEVHNANMLYPSRIGQERVKLPGRGFKTPEKGSGPFKQLVQPKAVPSAASAASDDTRISASKLDSRAQETLRKRGVSLVSDKAKCLSENRPKDTRGNGGSRPFVPWCQKGKK